MKIRVKTLLGGLATFLLPPLAEVMGRRNYPRVGADYYYRVWLSHVCMADHFGCWEAPETVLEIGPGNSLGVGLAALLTGVRQYLAYDRNALLHPPTNPQLLTEIAQLYQRKADFAESGSGLLYTAFPHPLFSAERLACFLSPQWRQQLVDALEHRNELIRYYNDPAAVAARSVDYLFSHSVLEHVDDLAAMYASMWQWLKPGGLMTHSIDFSSHGSSNHWNGHWTVPDWLWRLMKGKRRYFLNRVPLAQHQALLARQGFELKGVHSLTRASLLTRADLAPRFRDLPEADLTTSSAFLVARKPLS